MAYLKFSLKQLEQLDKLAFQGNSYLFAQGTDRGDRHAYIRQFGQCRKFPQFFAGNCRIVKLCKVK